MIIAIGFSTVPPAAAATAAISVATPSEAEDHANNKHNLDSTSAPLPPGGRQYDDDTTGELRTHLVS